MTAIVYTKGICVWCDRVKKLLSKHNYEIEELIVGKDISREVYVDTLRNTVPLVIINNKVIGGYQDTLDYLNKK